MAEDEGIFQRKSILIILIKNKSFSSQIILGGGRWKVTSAAGLFFPLLEHLDIKGIAKNTTFTDIHLFV